MLRLLLGLLLGVILQAPPVLADDPGPQVPALRPMPVSSAIYIDAQAVTWRYRGRVSFPLLAVLKTRLKEAGLRVVETPDDPHDLLLRVDYRETRGREFRFDLYGTDIVAQIDLTHPDLGSLLRLTVSASSRYPESESRPYVDAVEQFETSPYFYFLGELIKERLEGQTDVTETLIRALEGMPEQGQAADEHPLMLPSETLHVTWARQNAVRELGRLKDSRAVPVLTRLSQHPDWRIRLVSVRALGEIGSEPARAEVERAARHDADPEVRAAADTALAAPADATPPQP